MAPCSDSIKQLASDLREKTLVEAERRFILGITGPPGAGKSTLAQLLHETMLQDFGIRSTIVPMDGFHLDNETLIGKGIRHLKGIEESFDSEGFCRLIKRIREETDNAVSYPTFDREIDATIENAAFVPVSERLVLVEGNYLLHEKQPWHQARYHYDEIWYVDADESILFPRLLSRHIAGGMTEEQAREKVRSTDLANANVIAKTRAHATRIVTI